MNVYEIVTEKIIQKLEQGVVPWQKPWIAGRPKNLISQKEYRGINVLLLGLESYSSPYWLTYKQAKQKGGNVKKGEKSTLITFWKTYEDKNEETRRVLRYYRVFNVAQCENVDFPVEEERNNSPINCAETIVENMPKRPNISEGNIACYTPTLDTVTMPNIKTFKDSESYYSTLFHELTHSTMHKSRCDRDVGKHNFGGKDYSKEELVAEIGSCFLCNHCDIDVTFNNQVAYIESWLKALKSDVNMVISASGKAQKSTDFILGRGGENEN